MTPNRFDELSLAFANGVSRRSVLKTLAWSGVGSIFESFPLLSSRFAWAGQAQACVTATVSACIAAANAAFESESEGCQEIPNPTPPAIAKCIAAARKRRDAAVKACDPCPSNTRCESDVCCPNSQPTCAPPCKITRTNESSTLQSTVTSTVQGQNLVLTTTRTLPSRVKRSQSGATTFRQNDSPAGSATGTTAITLGLSPLVGIDYSSENGSIRTQVSYGPAFTGIKLAVFTSSGSLVQGNIDGRAVVPFGPGTDVSLMKFADGNPPPVVTIDPVILQATKAILAKGQSAASTCLQAQASSPTPLLDSPGCIACENRCGDKYWNCAEIAGAACIAALFGWAACEELALIKCQNDYDNCHRDCEIPGAACCPIACNGGCCDNATTCCPNALHGLACCGSGTRCASENSENGICCPQDSGPLCGNHCCPSGQICPDPQKGICCPAGSKLCGDTCCPVGQLCINNTVCCGPQTFDCGDGQCCPNGAPCIQGTCCAPPSSRACGGVCCGSLFACCNNVCCGANDLCVNNSLCCPRDQVCGHICCPAGQRCQNPATQTCAACPTGTAPCVSVGPNGISVSICCSPGANCCLGQCCTNQTGHECTGHGGACGTIH
jgi:hypothetical protein